MSQILINYSATIATVILIASTSHAQLKVAAYQEYEIENKTGDNYRIIPAGEKGVLIIFKNEKLEPKGMRNFEISLLDTALKKTWQSYFMTKYREELLSIVTSENYLHLLLVKDRFQYHIIKISLKDGKVTEATFDEYKRLNVLHFDAVDDMWFLAGTIKSSPIGIGLNSKLPQGTNSMIKTYFILPGINNERTSLIATTANQQGGLFCAIVTGEYGPEKHKLYINSYSLDGKLSDNISIEREGFYELLSFRPMVTDQGQLLLLGTYSIRGEKYAQGFYYMQFKDGKRILSRFYDLGFFTNFFKDLSEKKQNKIIHKIKKKREKGKVKRLRYRIILHQPYIINEEIQMIGEIYEMNDKSQRSTNLEMDTYGMPPELAIRYRLQTNHHLGSNYVPSFIGLDEASYKYDYPLIIEYKKLVAFGIDIQGMLKWDNILPYDPSEQRKEETPIQAMEMIPRKDSIIFVQANDDKILYKTSSRNQYVASDTLNSLEPYHKFQTDETDDFIAGGISYWYERNAIQCGIKKIRNKFYPDKNRKVFFISRLEYESE